MLYTLSSLDSIDVESSYIFGTQTMYWLDFKGFCLLHHISSSSGRIQILSTACFIAYLLLQLVLGGFKCYCLLHCISSSSAGSRRIQMLLPASLHIFLLQLVLGGFKCYCLLHCISSSSAGSRRIQMLLPASLHIFFFGWS